MRLRLARSFVFVVTVGWTLSAAANAAVTFNFESSRGFVDRSTVQAAFGLNNGQMQKRAGQVVFSAVQTYTLAVVCESGARHEAVMEITATVDFTTLPGKGSFDGFALAGLHDVVIADPQPPEEICGGAGSLGAQIAVVRTLSATLGGQSVALLEEH